MPIRALNLLGAANPPVHPSPHSANHNPQRSGPLLPCLFLSLCPLFTINVLYFQYLLAPFAKTGGWGISTIRNTYDVHPRILRATPQSPSSTLNLPLTVSLFVSWPSFCNRLSLFSILSGLFCKKRGVGRHNARNSKHRTTRMQPVIPRAVARPASLSHQSRLAGLTSTLPTPTWCSLWQSGMSI